MFMDDFYHLSGNDFFSNLMKPAGSSTQTSNPLEEFTNSISDFFANLFGGPAVQPTPEPKPEPKQIRRTGGVFTVSSACVYLSTNWMHLNKGSPFVHIIFHPQVPSLLSLVQRGNLVKLLSNPCWLEAMM